MIKKIENSVLFISSQGNTASQEGCYGRYWDNINDDDSLQDVMIMERKQNGRFWSKARTANDAVGNVHDKWKNGRDS